MKIAIIDDEKKVCDELVEAINAFSLQYKYPMEVTCFSNAESFINAFKKTPFVFIFMDIFLEGMNGIEAIQEIRKKDKNCLVIFITGSSDFMGEAFSCHAFDYLVKPITQERVFQILQDGLNTMPNEPLSMEVVSGRLHFQLIFSDIVYALSNGHYLDITTNDGKIFSCRMTKKEFLKKVNYDSRFISINKGIMVNIEYISHIQHGSCVMKNGATFPIRIRDVSTIESVIHDYYFQEIRKRQHTNRFRG